MGGMQFKFEKLQLETDVLCNCTWKSNEVTVQQEEIKERGEEKA